MPLANAASNGSSLITACKTKLYALNPAHPPQFVPTQRTRNKQRPAPADPKSLERQIRQTLADKISGNQVGIWLLLPEHLRLGTWDLVCSWAGRPAERVEPRLALHLVNEAAKMHPLVINDLQQQPFEVFDFFTPSEGEGWGEGEVAGVIASRWPTLQPLRK
jgi:hypothetical protein